MLNYISVCQLTINVLPYVSIGQKYVGCVKAGFHSIVKFVIISPALVALSAPARKVDVSDGCPAPAHLSYLGYLA